MLLPLFYASLEGADAIGFWGRGLVCLTLFIFRLHWFFIAACQLPLVVTSGNYSLVAVCRFLIVVAPLIAGREL